MYLKCLVIRLRHIPKSYFGVLVRGGGLKQMCVLKVLYRPTPKAQELLFSLFILYKIKLLMVLSQRKDEVEDSTEPHLTTAPVGGVAGVTQVQLATNSGPASRNLPNLLWKPETDRQPFWCREITLKKEGID